MGRITLIKLVNKVKEMPPLPQALHRSLKLLKMINLPLGNWQKCLSGIRR